MKTKIWIIGILVIIVTLAFFIFNENFQYNGYVILEEEVFEFGSNVPESFYQRTLNTYACSHSNTVGRAQAVECISTIDSAAISYVFYEDNWKLIGVSLILSPKDYKTLESKFSIEQGKELSFLEIPFGIFYRNGYLYSKLLHENWIYLNVIELKNKIDILELPPSNSVEIHF